MSGAGQWHWAPSEESWVWALPTGWWFNQRTQQWVPPPGQHPYGAQGQQQGRADLPRTPTQQVRSLTQVPSHDETRIWTQSSPTDTSAYNTARPRTLSSSQDETRPQILRPPHVRQHGQPATDLPIRSARSGANPPTGYNHPTQAQQANHPGQSGNLPTQESSRAQPGPSRPVHRDIPGTQGDFERFDHRYKLRRREFFRPFRVFMILWAEPCYDKNSIAAGRSSAVVTRAETLNSELAQHLPPQFVRDRRFGQLVFTKIRYLVVVQDRGDRCMCVPIVTYKDQGVAKSGVIKSEHAIAYTGEETPRQRPNERPVGDEKPMRPAVRITPDETGDLLDDMSRIHYGRIYTVEKNVKVRAFGWVHPKFQKDLYYTWKDVLVGTDDFPMSQESRSTPEEHEDESEEDSSEDEENDDGQTRPGAVYIDPRSGAIQTSLDPRNKAPIRDNMTLAGSATAIPTGTSSGQRGGRRLPPPSTRGTTQPSRIRFQEPRVQQPQQRNPNVPNVPIVQRRTGPTRARPTTDVEADDGEEEDSSEASGDERRR